MIELVAILAAASATEVAGPPTPSATAIALARSLRPPVPILLGGDRPPAQMIEAVAGNMLRTITSRGLGCEPTLKACADAAHFVATEEVRELSASRTEFAVAALALAIDQHMSGDEVAAATRIVATPPGRALATALLAYGNPTGGSLDEHRQTGRLYRSFAESAPRYDVYYARFYERTRNLPRGNMPAAPPPVIPPPPTGKPKP